MTKPVKAVDPEDLPACDMSAVGRHRFARISPRKAMLLMDLVRGRSVDDALDTLRFCRQRAAQMIAKVIKSAAANLDDQIHVNGHTGVLVVSQATVDGGPVMRRFQPKDRGKAHPIKKRTSHLSVRVSLEVRARSRKKRRFGPRATPSVGGSGSRDTINRLTLSTSPPKMGDGEVADMRVVGADQEQISKKESDREGIPLDTRPSIRDERPRMALRFANWRITWRNHMGPTWTFSEATSGAENPQYPDPSLFQARHDLRIQIYSPFSEHRACLFLDRFTVEESKQVFFGVMWAHCADLNTLWTASREFAVAATARKGGSSSVRWLINGRHRPAFGDSNVSVLPAVPPQSSARGELTGLYVEVGDFEFEAQLARIDGHDKILSLILPMLPESSFTALIARLIHATKAAGFETVDLDGVLELLEDGFSPISAKSS